MKHTLLLLLTFGVSTFSFSQNYTILGDASSLGGCNCFRLTPDANDQAGAIFQNQTINLNNSFDFTFNGFLGCNNGNDAADGIVFVLTNNPNGLGSGGGGLGYGGNNQPFSFAVEFDTWENSQDPSYDHIAIESGGIVNHNVAGPVPALPNSGNIDNCQWYTIRIVWDVNTNTFSVYFNGVLRLSTVVPNMVSTYFNGNPIVNWGWTAGTGGGTNDQQVCVMNTSSWVAGVNYQWCSPTVQFTDVSTSSLGSVQSWAWNFGDGTTSTQQNPSHTYAGNGTYNVTLTITDISGCTNTYSHNVVINPPITLTPTLTQPLCNGGANGAISVSPAGGFGPSAGYGGFRYSWNGGINTQQLYNGIPAGTYSVTVTDGVCTTTGNYTLNQPTPLTATTSHTDATCGSNNGTASITLSGGTQPYTAVTWGIGGTGNTVSNLAPGVYVADFHDANGCSSLLQYRETISQLPCGYNLSTSSTNVTCYGGSNGSATLTVTGGIAPINISWSNGGSGATISGLPAGNYTYNYSDGNGQTFTGTVTVNQPGAAIAAAITTINMSCANTNDGQALASVTAGGTSPFTYAWSRGTANGASVSGLTPGPISVTITDASGCTASASGTITGPPTLTLNITSIDDSCYQSHLGSATANVSGGNPPYTYYWDNISSAQTNLNLGIGTYHVTVTDDRQCTITGTATINEPTALLHTLTSQNIACSGSNSGSITITPSGGTPVYSYTWSPGSVNGGSPANLPAGQYYVTITDANNCLNTDSALITEPPTPLTVTTSHTDVTCNGASDGSVTITIAGGVPPYNYLGNPIPPGTTTIPGLGPNTYAGSVTDANNCSIAVSETIVEPAALSVIETHTDINCYGDSSGTIDITASGGRLPYTFAWNDGDPNEDRNLLGPGNYAVTVTDSSMCTASVSATIVEPAELTLSETHTDVLCNGQTTGAIDITVTGGTTAYSFIWNDGNTNEDRTSLAAGMYDVTVYDAHQCSITLSVTISEPAALSATTSHTDALCNGSNDGTITITITGGTMPYSYLGNPIPAGPTTIPGLAPATYAGNITDANGCTFPVSETITEPGPQSLAILSVTDNVCNGGLSGAVSVDFVNATGTVVYDWNPGGVQPSSRTGLTAATYVITATDQNNCIVVDSATVNEPAAPVMNVTISDALCFGGQGAATANPAGGTAPYSFAWSTTETSQTINPVAGTYTVTATDANSCNQTGTGTINEPTELLLSETHVDVLCYDDSTGSINITPSGGTGPNYTYAWLPNVSNTNTANTLPAGNYEVTVEDVNACAKTIQVIISQPTQPLTINIQSDNVLCNSQSTGSITIISSGGTPNYSYAWTPNVSTTNTATGLNAGSYSITVTDANGCNTNPLVPISEPAQPITVTDTFTNLTCFQSNDGTATVFVSGGTGTYTYIWTNNVSTGSVATSLVAGNYTVTITDANACSTTQNFTLTQPALLTASETHQNILCAGDATGSIDVNAAGGTTPYSYSWSPNVSTTDTASGLTANTYTIVVTDTNTCTTSVTVDITEPAPLDVTATTTDVLCFGGSTGTITATGSGGVTAYSFTATDGTNTYPSANGSFTALATGNYTVYISDQNQCADSVDITVNEPAALTITVTPTPTLCNMSADGQVEVVPTGGVPSYTFALSNSDVNQSGLFTGLVAGTYQVTATDANGCSVTDQTVVTEPDSVLISVSPNPLEVDLGQEITLNVQSNQVNQVLTYAWTPSLGLSCTDCQNPVFTGVYSQQYLVTVINENGCTGITTFEATVIPKYEVFIPNVFTPDDNGTNDDWQIFLNTTAVKQIQVKVFNRIGEKVFESNDIGFKWNGEYKGEKLPPGVYVYTAKFVWLDNHSDSNYTGSITLLR